jgi:hypothetical protein
MMEVKNKPNSVQIVKLNIGNTKFVTSLETLKSVGDNYLTALFTSKNIPGEENVKY